MTLGRTTLNPKSTCSKNKKKGTSAVHTSLTFCNFPSDQNRGKQSGFWPQPLLPLPARWMTQAPGDVPWPPHPTLQRASDNHHPTPYSVPVALTMGRGYQGRFLNGHGCLRCPERGTEEWAQGAGPGGTGLSGRCVPLTSARGTSLSLLQPCPQIACQSCHFSMGSYKSYTRA